ncbi:hypothetical protein AAFF_G00025840 [Aldrovandia affinis]|uniref:SOCS box domain-containing protein n=1 Tax=Aldrovandia affinis TaxID=143900 RepID=A0AAD7S5E3_9TELE|nr:hypothetical protein AAFF_G00025840 [Aldrovandia affinis]
MGSIEDTLLKAKLLQLECHFTWGLDKNDTDFNDLQTRLKTRIEMEVRADWKIGAFHLLAFTKYLQGLLEEAREDLEKAEEHIRKYENCEKRLMVTYGNFAWVYYYMGEHAQSQTYLEKLDEVKMRFPTEPPSAIHPVVYGEKASTFLTFALKYHEKGIECYKKALEVEPQEIEWNTGYAIALYRTETTLTSLEESPASKQLRRALELDPNNAHMMVLLGLKHAVYKEYQKAEELVERALELEPDNPYVTRYVAKFFRQQGSVEKSIRLLNRALERTPNSSFLHHQLALNYKSKRGLGPWSFSAYGSNGAEVRELLSLSIHHLEEAISLKPSFIYAMAELGLSYAEGGDIQKAEEMFQKTFKVATAKNESLQVVNFHYAVFQQYHNRSEPLAIRHYKEQRFLVSMEKVGKVWSNLRRGCHTLFRPEGVAHSEGSPEVEVDQAGGGRACETDGPAPDPPAPRLSEAELRGMGAGWHGHNCVLEPPQAMEMAVDRDGDADVCGTGVPPLARRDSYSRHAPCGGRKKHGSCSNQAQGPLEAGGRRSRARGAGLTRPSPRTLGRRLQDTVGLCLPLRPRPRPSKVPLASSKRKIHLTELMLETCPFPPGSDLARKWHLIKRHTAPVCPPSSSSSSSPSAAVLLLDAQPSPDDDEEHLRERRRLSIEEGVDAPPDAQIHSAEAPALPGSLYKLGPNTAGEGARPGSREGRGRGRVAGAGTASAPPADCDSDSDSTTLCLQARRPKQRHASGRARPRGPAWAWAWPDGAPGRSTRRSTTSTAWCPTCWRSRACPASAATAAPCTRASSSGTTTSASTRATCVFHASTVTGLLEHYKDPGACMFFEPLLTAPLHRALPFSLQRLARAAVCRRTSYDAIGAVPLPASLRDFLREYHYKQKVRVRWLERE